MPNVPPDKRKVCRRRNYGQRKSDISKIDAAVRELIKLVPHLQQLLKLSFQTVTIAAGAILAGIGTYAAIRAAWFDAISPIVK